MGGFQYKDNVLQFFPTAEGYVKNDSGVLSYVFQYKDHLGNVRVSYAKNPVTQVLEIIEENNYYPFGLKHNGYNDYLPITNKYNYNGKELQDELGLNFYDYGARNYDPAIGRWMNIDPLAEKSRRFNPYTYALNNPVYFIDPDGMRAEPPIGLDVKNGTVHTDNSGSWKYNSATTTWEDQNGKNNIGNTIELDNVNIKGYKNNYVSSGEYGPSKDSKDVAMAVGIVTLPVLAVTGGLTGGAAYLYSEGISAVSSMTIADGATGIVANATSQYIANGGKVGDINIIEAGSSAIPGIGPVIFGETFSYSANNFIKNEGIQAPDSFAKWSAQVGGGIISNRFGKATDNYLVGEGIGGKVIGEYFKGIIETGSNAAPNLIK